MPVEELRNRNIKMKYQAAAIGTQSVDKWILATGLWRGEGRWFDGRRWKDSAVYGD